MKHPTISIRSYFTVKQRDLPELEKVASSSVAEAMRKNTIDVKHATDEEGDSSESKRGAYENTYIIFKYSVYIRASLTDNT